MGWMEQDDYENHRCSVTFSVSHLNLRKANTVLRLWERNTLIISRVERALSPQSKHLYHLVVNINSFREMATRLKPWSIARRASCRSGITHPAASIPEWGVAKKQNKKLMVLSMFLSRLFSLQKDGSFVQHPVITNGTIIGRGGVALRLLLSGISHLNNI